MKALITMRRRDQLVAFAVTDLGIHDSSLHAVRGDPFKVLWRGRAIKRKREEETFRYYRRLKDILPHYSNSGRARS